MCYFCAVGLSLDVELLNSFDYACQCRIGVRECAGETRMIEDTYK